MRTSDSSSSWQRDPAAIDVLAMLVEYALVENRENRLPTVTFLLKMARHAIQAETASDGSMTIFPDRSDETIICPFCASDRPASS